MNDKPSRMDYRQHQQKRSLQTDYQEVYYTSINSIIHLHL